MWSCRKVVERSSRSVGLEIEEAEAYQKDRLAAARGVV